MSKEANDNPKRQITIRGVMIWMAVFAVTLACVFNAASRVPDNQQIGVTKQGGIMLAVFGGAIIGIPLMTWTIAYYMTGRKRAAEKAAGWTALILVAVLFVIPVAIISILIGLGVMH